MAQQWKIGTHATTVYTQAGKTIVVYHSTAVVTFDENTIALDTGGHFSTTTKTRMNQASQQFDLGYLVYEKNGKWFADFKGWLKEFDGNRLELIRNKPNAVAA